MSTAGVAAEQARSDVRELIAAKGHVTENARLAVARLEAAFAAGDLQRTPEMMLFLADLAPALEQAEGQKLGGKSAEAARSSERSIGSWIGPDARRGRRGPASIRRSGRTPSGTPLVSPERHCG